MRTRYTGTYHPMHTRRGYQRMDPEILREHYRHWFSQLGDWADLDRQYGHRVARRAMRRCAVQVRRIESVAHRRDIRL